MAKVIHTCTGCVPIDASIIEAYVALLKAGQDAAKAEEAREAAESERESTFETDHEASVAATARANEAAERAENAGKYYGFFPTVADLPSDAKAPGYAMVGATSPFAIYDFDGVSWTDSGATLDSIKGPKGDKGNIGPAGPVGPQGPIGPQGIQGNTGSSVSYPYELVNNCTTDDATKGLSAAQGVALAGEINQLDQELNENIPINITTTLVQGYASTSGGYINLGTLETRIRTYIIKGNYTIKLKPGYVIRGVVGWTRSGNTEENPTERFPVAGAANLNNGTTATSFTKNDSTTAYSIVTICKTDADADISPTEDCIESFVSDKTTSSLVERISGVETDIIGEQLPNSIVQGYVLAQNDEIEVTRSGGNYGTRVMTSILPGNYVVTVKSGYVIRSVVAWDGGETSGNPTADFTTDGCATLLSSGSATTFEKNDEWSYSIIVFCKDNSSANIIPTEDIIERLSIYPGGLADRLVRVESKVASEYYTTIDAALVMGDSINYGLASYFNGSLSGVVVDTSNRISDYLANLTGILFDNIAARGTGYAADTRGLGNGWVKAQSTNFGNYGLVFICLGINDYIQHETIGDLSTKVEGTVVGNMTRILDKIATDNPFCKVVICSPYNAWGQVCDDPGSEYSADTLYGDESTDYALGFEISGHTLSDYIDAIDDVCKFYHVQHVKLSESGAINRANIKKVLADGLHPVVEARPMLAAELLGRKMFDK